MVAFRFAMHLVPFAILEIHPSFNGVTKFSIEQTPCVRVSFSIIVVRTCHIYISGYLIHHFLDIFSVLFVASLEAIGITYTGVSETIVVNYNYAYNAAVNAFLPTGVTYKVNNKTFKEAVNNVEGSYNFLYTKYINSSTISETGSDIISATVDNSILGRRLDLNDGNPTQTFIFTYDTSVNNWIYVTSIVDLADYGISFVGTPHNNDTITVVANVSTGWSLDYVGVNPANYGITISAGALVIGNRLSVTFAYNTNYAYVDRSTTAFFIDDIIINTDRYRSAVNDDTNNIVFTYLSSNPD